MAGLYQWWVLLHIVGVTGFLLAHGVSAGVTLKLRKERDRARIQSLLDLSSSTITWLYVSLMLLLAGGIIAGFAGGWWGSGWIWASIGLLLAIMGFMYAVSLPHFKKLRSAVTIRPSGNPQVSDEELAYLLTSWKLSSTAAIGFVGLLLIVYLMVMKPF